MKNQHILMVLFSTLFSVSVHAQGYNVTKGYVVYNNGDTLHGFLKDRGSLGNLVSFRVAGASSFTEYSYEQVRAVRYSDGYYFKAVPSEKRFLLCLVEGPMDLFKYEDFYFVQKKGELPVKLEKAYPVIGGGNREDTRYIGLLKATMADCADVQKKASNMALVDRQLIDLVEQYNHCKDASWKPTISRTSIRIQFKKGVRAGLAFNKMGYTDANNRKLDFETNTAFSGGIFFNFSYRDKLSIQPELLFMRKTGVLQGNQNNGLEPEFVIKQSWLQMPVSLYYTFPTHIIRPFLFVGGQVGLAIQSEAKKHFGTTAFDLGPSNFETGVRLGAGLEWKRSEKNALYLEFLNENTIERTDYVNRNIHNKAYHISLRASF